MSIRIQAYKLLMFNLIFSHERKQVSSKKENKYFNRSQKHFYLLHYICTQFINIYI